MGRIFAAARVQLLGTDDDRLWGGFTPASGFASICANPEALTAQIYLAVVIARLVGIRTTQSHS
jgi:hypothetical protein